MPIKDEQAPEAPLKVDQGGEMGGVELAGVDAALGAKRQSKTCDVEQTSGGGQLYRGHTRAYWERIVVAVIGAITIIIGAYLGRK